MKLPYFSLKMRLIFSDLYRIWFQIRIWIRIRIWIQNVWFQFRIGSGQKFRILTDPDPVPDPDPQHWKK